MSAENGRPKNGFKRSGNPYTRVVSSVIFPLHERIKGHSTVRIHQFMERSQWWSPEELRGLQTARLRTFLSSVQQRVPFYRRLFADIGFQPSCLTSLQDLASLPFLSKDIIRAHTDDLKAEGARGLTRSNTGGSTGEPLIFFVSKQRTSHDVAAKWRATRWWQLDIGDPEVVVWGSPVELQAQDWLRFLRDRLLRTHLLPAFEMSPRRLDEFVDTITRLRPRMMFGYPSALALIAQHAERRGISMADLGIQVVFVTAERLFDHQRKLIESTFQCRVANGYGGRDAGFIAHECPDGGMHITAEDVIVEVVNPEGQVLPPGKAGEVVVTHLATEEFPFIRYRTADVAILDENLCPCGRGLPLLKEIQGRATDFIVATDGTVMHGLALIYVVRDVEGVQNFQIMQEERDHIRVQLVTGSDFDERSIESMRAGIRKRLGSGVDVSFERVRHISPSPSGKYRYVMSKVAPPVG